MAGMCRRVVPDVRIKAAEGSGGGVRVCEAGRAERRKGCKALRAVSGHRS